MRCGLLLVCLVLVAGCGAPPPPPEPAAATRPQGEIYRSSRYSFGITYPSDLQAAVDLGQDYLQRQGWSLTADPQIQTGLPVLSIALPGSNAVTSAELRIGLSEARADVAACERIPPEATPGSPAERLIQGVPFTTFALADAGMSHFREARAFRTVHEGTCYAIDVVVSGTTPAVYDPPARPPFTIDYAFSRLLPIVETFRFLED